MAKIMTVFVALVIVFAFAGCKPVPPAEKVEEATDQVCKDLILYNTSVDKLLADEYESRNALEAQFDVVRRNFTNLVQSIANVQSVETENFQKAADDLITAYQNVPQDATIQDTVEQLKDPIAEVKSAGDLLTADLKCVP